MLQYGKVHFNWRHVMRVQNQPSTRPNKDRLSKDISGKDISGKEVSAKGTASKEVSKKGSVKVDQLGLNSDSKKIDTSSSARINLSERAQDMKRITDIAKSIPDVDEAKVAKYQKLIDSGEYKVDAEAVADKMVDEFALTGE